MYPERPLHHRIWRRFLELTEPRDFYIRRNGMVRYWRMPRWLQVGFICLFVGSAGWLANVTVVYFGFDHILEQKNDRLARFEAENSRLSLRVNSMRDNMTDVAGTLKQSHHNLVGLLEQNDTLRADIAALKKKLNASEARRAHQIRRYSALNQKLKSLESNLVSSKDKGSMLASVLDQVRTDLGKVQSERDSLAETEKNANQQIAALQGRVQRLRDEQKEALDRIADKTVHDIKRIEKIITVAGLKPLSLLKKLDPEAYAVGGPFIASPDDAKGFNEGPTAIDRHVAHWDALRRVLANLPLVAPVDHYKITSKFGRRRDPINNKWATHQGLDLGAPNRTPVYAPVPGKVVYTGWKGYYGRFVEIDHGMGIRTRYGHLRRIYVRRGQRVDYRKKIGQVGSSGRSTGPHLHYEIIVNGKRIDPLKFLEAGKDVFKG